MVCLRKNETIPLQHTKCEAKLAKRDQQRQWQKKSLAIKLYQIPFCEIDAFSFLLKLCVRLCAWHCCVARRVTCCLCARFALNFSHAINIYIFFSRGCCWRGVFMCVCVWRALRKLGSATHAWSVCECV